MTTKNSKCLCGSGKKYKICCWASERRTAQAPQAQAPQAPQAQAPQAPLFIDSKTPEERRAGFCICHSNKKYLECCAISRVNAKFKNNRVPLTHEEAVEDFKWLCENTQRMADLFTNPEALSAIGIELRKHLAVRLEIILASRDCELMAIKTRNYVENKRMKIFYRLFCQ